MQLDKNQADAIAEALIQPDVEHKNALREKRAAAERDQAAKRYSATCGFIGFAIGGATGYLASLPIVRAALVGGIAGALLGRLYKWVIARR